MCGQRQRGRRGWGGGGVLSHEQAMHSHVFTRSTADRKAGMYYTNGSRLVAESQQVFHSAMLSSMWVVMTTHLSMTTQAF